MTADDNQAVICLASNQSRIWQIADIFIAFSELLVNTHSRIVRLIRNHYWNNNRKPLLSMISCWFKAKSEKNCQHHESSFLRQIGWIISRVSSQLQTKGKNGMIDSDDVACLQMGLRWNDETRPIKHDPHGSERQFASPDNERVEIS